MKKTKGILLAGGTGSRLHPTTRGASKQLLPIYNKPMIYYPLSCLMFSNIRDVLIITTPEDQAGFQRLLGDGSWLGMNFSYAAQPKPEGIAQAFLIGEKFIGNDRVALALGDNIFFGHGLPEEFEEAVENDTGATIFAYEVSDPERYGVVTFDENKQPISIVEKPKNALSRWAVTGFYFYDNTVVDVTKGIKSSPRGELEISDVNQVYLKNKDLAVSKLGRGIAWLDTGTFHSMLQASVFVESIEERQGLMVSCLEEIAFRKGYITKEQLHKLGEAMSKNPYGQYLLRICEER